MGTNQNSDPFRNNESRLQRWGLVLVAEPRALALGWYERRLWRQKLGYCRMSLSPRCHAAAAGRDRDVAMFHDGVAFIKS
jgi:hypothetical protein